ncbi:MAG: tetratricopeptide repeat protein, partial [Anaerolineae bacterium]|nr:tetratricopeptide repeat protein [Anaerolineae bacterium]
ATTYNNIGAVHRARGEYEAALEWMTKSLVIFEEIGAQANAQVVRGNIAEVRRRMGGTTAD